MLKDVPAESWVPNDGYSGRNGKRGNRSVKLSFEKLHGMTTAAVDESSAQNTRQWASGSRDWYDGYQFTAAEKEVLRKRGQKANAWNGIRPLVDAMVGIEQQSRNDPQALPRGPEDEQAAEVATHGLRFIADNVRFDSIKSMAFENLLIEGTGAVDVVVQPKRDRLEIELERVRFEELIYDPHSREKDFRDAGYMGRQRWTYLDAALALYGPIYEGTDEQLAAILTGGLELGDSTMDDRPNQDAVAWYDPRQERVRVVSLYYLRDGKWYLAIFGGGGEIYHEISPYLDEDGEPTCTIEAMTAYVDRQNRRVGMVVDLLAIQDEINKRTSRALHLFTSRQTAGPKGSIADVGKLQAQKNDPNAHIEYDVDALPDSWPAGIKPFEILGDGDHAQGQFALLANAKEALAKKGPNASLRGQISGNASGRAIRQQQQAGMAEIAPIYDILGDWTLRVYRAMWARMRQFWTEERFIRVSGETKASEFVAINKVRGFEQQPQPDGTIALQPVWENLLGEMDVDIIIDSTPDYANMLEQSFEQMTQLAQAGVPIPPEMMIQASSLNNKREILTRMEEQQQGQQQAQQQAMQIEGAKISADIESERAGAADDMASAQKKAAETQKIAIETQRLALGY